MALLSAPASLRIGFGDESTPERIESPLHTFRFDLTMRRVSGVASAAVDICRGGFSECTGLEATMEPKVIKAGGHNYGAAQRVGRVSFATVVLKRGFTRSHDLFSWFQLVSGGAYAWRLSATIVVRDADERPVLVWELDSCLPVKFKAADLNAKGSEIGIEELHLAHEGLRLVAP
mgnify:FL=1